MKTQILNLKDARILSKEDQKTIHGGFFGCQPQIIECNSDSDCPCSSCGITFSNNGVEYFVDISAY